MNLFRTHENDNADSSGRWTIRYETHPAESPIFSRSLRVILEAALRDQSADAVCLYEYFEPGVLVLRERIGATLGRLETANLELSAATSEWLRDLNTPEIVEYASRDHRVVDFPEVLLHQFKRFTVAPVRFGLQLRGFLTVGWNTPTSDGVPDRLQPLVNGMAALLARGGQVNSAGWLMAEIAKLESDLVDWKIAERAVGVLKGNSFHELTPFALQEHVSRVLDGPDVTRDLRQHLAALQARVSDRQILAKAKLHLQQSLKVSEEQAYIWLRNSSRRSRRPMREIAQEVLGATRESGDHSMAVAALA